MNAKIPYDITKKRKKVKKLENDVISKYVMAYQALSLKSIAKYDNSIDLFKCQYKVIFYFNLAFLL